MEEKQCLVVCAGECTPFTIGRLGSLDHFFVIAADGGYLSCDQYGITPDLIIGDFDSAPRPCDHENIIIFPSHKNDTDCMLAVKEGLSRGYTEFYIVGATGGRFDHTLANLQVLSYLAKSGARGTMVDDKHMTTVLGKEMKLEIDKFDGYLSVLSLSDKCTGVTLRGVEYPLTNATLYSTFALGVSNHITQQKCTISFDEGLLLVMAVDD